MGGHAILDELDGHTLLGVPRFGLSRSSAANKRLFDLTLSVVVLSALAPLLAVIALVLRLDSSGPILFTQWRIGEQGIPFACA